MDVGQLSRGCTSSMHISGPCTTSGRTLDTYRCSAHVSLKQQRLRALSCRPLTSAMVSFWSALTSFYGALRLNGVQR